MPEGDTIYRVAARMQAFAVGRKVSRFHDRRSEFDPGQFTGKQFFRVEARGKHLLMAFEGGAVLHSHMGMTGAWHIYRPGTPWQKPDNYCRLHIDLGGVELVLFSPKLIETLRDTALARHPQLARLGPDLLSPMPNLEDACERLRQHNAVPLGVALMNQQLVAGIGNVYKSELLFIERLSPFVPVASLPDERLLEVLSRARFLMRRNLDGSPRRTRYTTKGPRLWVYNRHRQPCFVCGASIERTLQGDAGRSTYFCPDCQSHGGSASAVSSRAGAGTDMSKPISEPDT